MTKAVKDLEAGDKVLVYKPGGVAVVRSKQKSKLFKAEGGCWRLDLQIVEGPNAGKWIKDQHLPGIAECEQP